MVVVLLIINTIFLVFPTFLMEWILRYYTCERSSILLFRQSGFRKCSITSPYSLAQWRIEHAICRVPDWSRIFVLEYKLRHINWDDTATDRESNECAKVMELRVEEMGKDTVKDDILLPKCVSSGAAGQLKALGNLATVHEKFHLIEETNLRGDVIKERLGGIYHED